MDTWLSADSHNVVVIHNKVRLGRVQFPLQTAGGAVGCSLGPVLVEQGGVFVWVRFHSQA